MLMSVTRKEFFGEFAGTFLLVLFGCYSVTVSVLFDVHSGLMQIGIIWGIAVTLAVYAPRNIGLAVTSIICLLATLTQAGLNPARYFGLRFVGWGSAAFPDESGGFFIVYIADPIVCGVLAAWLFKYFIDRLLGRTISPCCHDQTSQNSCQ